MVMVKGEVEAGGNPCAQKIGRLLLSADSEKQGVGREARCCGALRREERVRCLQRCQCLPSASAPSAEPAHQCQCSACAESLFRSLAKSVAHPRAVVGLGCPPAHLPDSCTLSGGCGANFLTCTCRRFQARPPDRSSIPTQEFVYATVTCTRKEPCGQSQRPSHTAAPHLISMRQNRARSRQSDCAPAAAYLGPPTTPNTRETAVICS